MASAIHRISARLNIPTCPYISVPGFKKTELANILQFLSTNFLCLGFFIALFVFVASFRVCFVVRHLCGSDCRPDYEQYLFFLCLSSKRARHTNDHARDWRRPRFSCLRRSTLACTPSQPTVNRPGDRLNFANLTSFLWSIRVQTMENCCRLVQKRRLFNSRKVFCNFGIEVNRLALWFRFDQKFDCMQSLSQD